MIIGGGIVLAVQTSAHKSVKKAEPQLPSHTVDDDMADDTDVEVAHGPFAAHVDKSGISLNQVCQVLKFADDLIAAAIHLCCTCSPASNSSWDSWNLLLVINCLKLTYFF